MAQILQMICGVCGQENSAAGTTCPACGAAIGALPLQQPDLSTGPGDQTRVIGSFPVDRADQTTRLDHRNAPTQYTSGNGSSPADAPTIGPDTPTTKAGVATGGHRAVIGPLPIGKDFGRYHIIRMLGIGGMGAVYQAWDGELEVAVAIKVIRPETMKDPRAAAEVERRFKRELLLARQVTHKNVVRIHDIGEIDGIKYITMAYVNGTDLATHIKEEGAQS